MQKMLKDVLDITQAKAIASVTEDGQSSEIDLQDAGSCTLVVVVGATSGNDFSSSHKIDLGINHGDESGTLSACAGTDIFEPETGTIAKSLDSTADASSIHLVHYKGNKRYIELNMAETGTVDVPIAVVAVKGHLRFSE